MAYSSPRSLDDALSLLAGKPMKVLAGGTDVYPGFANRPLGDDLLDISAIEELRGVTSSAGGWRFGAATTWTGIVRAPLPRAFDGLKAAAREIGSVQIQNTATIGGNLCNASPAADGVPALLTLDAEVELASVRGLRRLPVAGFLRGVRETALEPGEILAAIHVPHQRETARSHFSKLGSRAYLVISIAMVAIVIDLDSAGRIGEIRIAVGACSPVALRLPELESKLNGRLIGDAAAAVSVADLAALSPIDDVRGTADYRKRAAAELIRRGLSSFACEVSA